VCLCVGTMRKFSHCAVVCVVISPVMTPRLRLTCGGKRTAHGSVQIVLASLYTAAGASRDVRAQTERTPLHVAAANQQPDVVAALLAASAPHDAKDAGGNVPLHLAVQVRWSARFTFSGALHATRR